MVPLFYFFSNMGGQISFKSNVLGFVLWNLISTIKRCPVLSSCDILSKIFLNSVILGTCSCFLIQPMGKVLSSPDHIDCSHPFSKFY